MKFEVKADFQLEAKNIDEAMKAVSQHFLDVMEGKDSHMIERGTVSITKVEE